MSPSAPHETGPRPPSPTTPAEAGATDAKPIQNVGAGATDSPLPRFIAPLLGPPLAGVFAAAARYRARAYDQGRRPVARVDRPVISVGNLSAGGTGKTPAVQWVVRRLQEAGLRPAIALRGYRGQNPPPSADPRFVAAVTLNPGECAGRRPAVLSDEAQEHRLRAPGVPVLVNPDRAAAIRACLAGSNDSDAATAAAPDVFVLDDGFQHRRLHRDFDLVLIDVSRPAWRDRPLPWGYLREPPAALARAHAVALTRLNEPDPDDVLRHLAEAKRRLSGNLDEHTLVVGFRHAWSGLRVMADATRSGPSGVGRPDSLLPVEWLQGRRIVVACAIGNPAAFVRQAEAAGADVRGRVIRGDHAPWRRRDFDHLAALAARARAEGVLTTLKDWVKMERTATATATQATGSGAEDAPGPRLPCPILCPVLDLLPAAGCEDACAALADRLVAIGRRAKPDAVRGVDPASAAST